MRYTDPTKIKERMSRECRIYTWSESDAISLGIYLFGKSLIRSSLCVFVPGRHNVLGQQINMAVSWYRRGCRKKWSGHIHMNEEILAFVVAIAIDLNGGTVGSDGFTGCEGCADNPKCWSGTNPLIDHLEETMPNNPDVMEFTDAYCRAK